MKKEEVRRSNSKVIVMCEPAGAGKSTFAKNLGKTGMTILSYEHESFKRGWIVHPLPAKAEQDIKDFLDRRLTALIEQNKDAVLDKSFWSKKNRME